MKFWLTSEVCTVCDSEKMFEDSCLLYPDPITELVSKTNANRINGEPEVRAVNKYIFKINYKTGLQVCVNSKLVYFD